MNLFQRKRQRPFIHPTERCDIELVMYARTFGCWDQARAEAWLREHSIPYRVVDISREPGAAERLLHWVGYLSVPTFIIARPGEDEPIAPPEPLNGRRPRGLHRGTLITEPSNEQLLAFLLDHKLVAIADNELAV